MKTYPEKYYYQVCPFCNSKNIRVVAMVPAEGKYRVQLGVDYIDWTGWMCTNCKRYHEQKQVKHIIDRAEMRRDIKRLNEFLEEKK